MTTPDMQFLIKLNCKVNFQDLSTWFIEEWQDLHIRWSTKALGETESNFVEIDHDYENPTDPASRYFLVQVIPKQAGVPTDKQIEEQVDFARRLMAKLTEKDCSPEFDNCSLGQYLQHG